MLDPYTKLSTSLADIKGDRRCCKTDSRPQFLSPMPGVYWFTNTVLTTAQMKVTQDEVAEAVQLYYSVMVCYVMLCYIVFRFVCYYIPHHIAYIIKCVVSREYYITLFGFCYTVLHQNYTTLCHNACVQGSILMHCLSARSSRSTSKSRTILMPRRPMEPDTLRLCRPCNDVLAKRFLM